MLLYSSNNRALINWRTNRKAKGKVIINLKGLSGGVEMHPVHIRKP
jgi:hypothetical protein